MKKRLYAWMLTAVMLIGMAVPVMAEEVEAPEEDLGSWELLDVKLPVARSGATATEVNGRIYVLSGRDFWLFDPVTQTWETKESSPRSREHGTLTHISGKIYAVGSSVGAATMDIYDIATDVWSSGPNMSGGKRLHFAGSADGKLYVFGGMLNGDYDFSAVYDPEINSWSALAKIPYRVGTAGSSAINLNGAFYIIGSYSTANMDPTSSRTLKYSIETDTWTELTPCPAIVGKSVFDCVGSKAYVVAGGHRMFEYDLEADLWREVAKFPGGSSYNATASVNGSIYVFGGAKGIIKVNEIYVFNPPASAMPPVAPSMYVLLEESETAQLSLSYNLAINTDYTWTSSNGAVATVDENGVVTAKAPGTCSIKADKDGLSETIHVKVIATEEVRLALHLKLGQAKRLWISDDLDSITWGSQNSNIVTVNAVGVVTGVSRGLCQITGEIDGKTYDIYVRVSN